MTLTEFLLAQIAEDERDALSAGGVQYDAVLTAKANPNLSAPHVAHIVRNSPNRVLAECEARRLLVEQFAESEIYGPDAEYLCRRGLALLALPYADHPDYRDEWRP